MRRERLCILCIILSAMWGCKPPSSSHITTPAVPPQPDLRKFLILIHTPPVIQGDSENASALEQWTGDGTLDSIEKIEVAALTANAWLPLKRNEQKWKAHPLTGRRMLGYYKANLYYVMFISPSITANGKPIRVTHVIAHKLPLTDSSGYFLPSH